MRVKWNEVRINGWIISVFYSQDHLIVLFELFVPRGRHDDGVGAGGVSPAHRGADRAGEMPYEARGQSTVLSHNIYCPTLNTVYKLFLFFAQNIYMSLLTLAFTSLSWKDTTNCHRTASMVCWTLLRQVANTLTLPFLNIFVISLKTHEKIIGNSELFCVHHDRGASIGPFKHLFH